MLATKRDTHIVDTIAIGYESLKRLTQLFIKHLFWLRTHFKKHEVSNPIAYVDVT